MKKIAIFLFIASILVSCIDPDNMVTVINPDGSCYRKIVRNVDSAFMVGDTAKSKIIVDLDSTWEKSFRYDKRDTMIEWPLKIWNPNNYQKLVTSTIEDKKIDDKEKSYQIKSLLSCELTAIRKYSSVEEMSHKFKLKNSHPWSQIPVNYHLEKKFRWYYTYYTYKEVYSKINTFTEIPIEKYFNPTEAELWFNGKPEELKGLNGIEIYEKLEDLKDKFNCWASHNLWIMMFKIYVNNIDYKFIPISLQQLNNERDSIFLKAYKKKNFMEKGIEPEDIIGNLDEYYKTKSFTDYYIKNKTKLDSIANNFKEPDFNKYFKYEMDYNLIMPGRITRCNNCVIHNDTISWKLTAYRMVYKNMEIEATSQKINYWAFYLTGLVILLAIISFFIKFSRNR